MLREVVDIERATPLIHERYKTNAYGLRKLADYTMFRTQSSRSNLSIIKLRPLYISTLLGNAKVTRLLLDNGAEPNEVEIDVNLT